MNRIRIGFELSIVDRIKTATGTSVYAKKIFQSLKNLEQHEYEFIPLYAPTRLSSKNILSKTINFLLEQLWLFVLLPIKARRLKLDLLYMPANCISPFLRSIPQICFIHDAHFLTNPKGRDRIWLYYARWIIRYSAQHANRIISPSESAKKEVVDLLGADPDNVNVVYHGISLSEIEPADYEKAHRLKPYLLSVGMILPHKNFEALVKAYAKLHREGKTNNHRLVLAGPPSHGYQSLLEVIDRENMEDHVSILGLVSDSMLAALYSNASIFVFPSLCEGFGFPPLEAMQNGVPVAASTATCIPETLGDAPLYFNPLDTDEMAEKIERIICDDSLREDLVKAGEARAKMFSWNRAAEKTLAVCQAVIKDFK